MSDLPDFTAYGYQITAELGHNLTGGRVTYLARHLLTQESVVLKTFQFIGQKDWQTTNYDAFQQESMALRRLNHPGIPRYLATFETENSFCLVQQYLEAESLAHPHSWTLDEIKQIALSLLRILVYLQGQTPPIIHRDIKPENILYHRETAETALNKQSLKLYLVDFGFARVGQENLAVSSMIKGTMGFMPPEQLFNRELTKASDLYGLGMTLICLLTGISSSNIGNYIGENYQVQFKHLIPPLQRGWLSWLDKMVHPVLKDRYQSAQEALNSLKRIDINQVPKVRCNPQTLHILATEWGKIGTTDIQLINPIPNTLLSGRWEVLPHEFDAPHTRYEHPWIEIEPQPFAGNTVTCHIKVNTQKLKVNQPYHRQLKLHSNALEDPILELYIHPCFLPPKAQINFVYLAGLFILMFFLGFVFHAFYNINYGVVNNIYLAVSFLLLCLPESFLLASPSENHLLQAIHYFWHTVNQVRKLLWDMMRNNHDSEDWKPAVIFFIGYFVLSCLHTFASLPTFFSFSITLIITLGILSLTIPLMIASVQNHIQRGFSSKLAIILTLFIPNFALLLGFIHPWLMLSSATTTGLIMQINLIVWLIFALWIGVRIKRNNQKIQRKYHTYQTQQNDLIQR